MADRRALYAILLLLPAACGHSSATPTALPVNSPTTPPFVPGKLGVTVLRSTGPHTLTRKAPLIMLRLVVHGLHLDAQHMGKTPVAGHGHMQVYLDRIPSDAYKQVDLKGVVADLAAPVFSVGFPPEVVKRKRGGHRLLVALARNDYILYRLKPAVIPITFK